MPAFNQQQWDELSKLCGLEQVDIKQPGLSINGMDLLNTDNCRKVLDELGPLLGAPSRKITASLLGKRISFLTTAACLYPMSAFDLGIDVSLENTVIDYSHNTKQWVSQMRLHDLKITSPSCENRGTWRQKLCKQLFCDNLSRLWQTFNEVSGIQLDILWENTAVRVYSLYERRLAKITSASIQKNVRDDFYYLLNQAEPSLFRHTTNPLQQFNFDKTPSEKGQTRYRDTCCYYYATPPCEYCSNCPLPLKQEKIRHA